MAKEPLESEGLGGNREGSRAEVAAGAGSVSGADAPDFDTLPWLLQGCGAAGPFKVL